MTYIGDINHRYGIDEGFAWDQAKRYKGWLKDKWSKEANQHISDRDAQVKANPHPVGSVKHKMYNSGVEGKHLLKQIGTVSGGLAATAGGAVGLGALGALNTVKNAITTPAKHVFSKEYRSDRATDKANKEGESVFGVKGVYNNPHKRGSDAYKEHGNDASKWVKLDAGLRKKGHITGIDSNSGRYIDSYGKVLTRSQLASLRKNYDQEIINCN